jgi:hypothetical protein
MSTVAAYYEQGKPIEGEFLESWEGVEQFYQGWNFPGSEHAMALIRSVQQNGYDHTLRAGTSLHVLIVSRSRRHGLREDQPYIAFSFGKRQTRVESHVGTEMEFTLTGGEFTGELDGILRKLQESPID